MSRVLEWDGCGNVRDLGGHPLEQGGNTRFGVVIRADNVRRLTPTGWETLLEQGVRRVVDLRWHEELAEDPPIDVPVEVVHVPIFGMHRLETRYVRFAELARTAADGPDFVRRLYGSYLDEHPRAFADAVAAVATADGPVVVHCTRGKDRTGLVSALILRIAGVSIDAIAADYGLSAVAVAEGDGDTPVAAMTDEGRARAFLLSAPPSGLAQALGDLEARHGSAAAFLEAGGLDRSMIDDLHDRLVGPRSSVTHGRGRVSDDFTCTLADVGAESLSLVGGKGANLGELVRAGLPVPRAFVVTTHAYRHLLEANGLEARILAELDGIDYEDAVDIERRASVARDLIVEATVPADLESAIRADYLELQRDLGTDLLVSVRSSATAEDLPGMSFAGQQDTYLNVSDADSLIDHVRRCWASLWTDRAISYRQRQGFAHEDVALAVVVQEMFPARVAGVMFTANPITSNPGELFLNASWGLGEAVVSGRVDPDQFIVDKQTLAITQRDIHDKRIMIVPRADRQGSAEVEVPEAQRTAASLTDAEIEKLGTVAHRIEDHYGFPQDIEWALAADGRIGILQSREITAADLDFSLGLEAWQTPEALASMTDERWVWSRAYSDEVQTGPSTPMFYTELESRITTLKINSMLWTDTTECLGYPAERFRDIPFFRWYGARAYYNLAWERERIRMFIPPFARDEAALWPFPAGEREEIRRMPFNWIRFLWIILKLHVTDPNISLLGTTQYFYENMERWTNHEAALWAALDWETATPREILETRQQAVRASGFRRKLSFTIYLYVVQAALRELLVHWCADESHQLYGRLCGGLHTKTSEENIALWRLSRKVTASASLSSLFAEVEDVAEILARLPETEDGPAFKDALDTFIVGYGHRGGAERDAFHPRWRHRPELVFLAVRPMLRLDDDEDPALVEEALHARMLAAKQECLRTVRRGIFGAVKSAFLKWLIELTQDYVYYRDYSRFWNDRTMSIPRDMYTAIARSFIARDLLIEEEDIFFLGNEEVVDVDEGRLDAHGVALRVRARRRVYEKYRHREPPKYIQGWRTFDDEHGPDDGLGLRGVAASSGVVTGRARVCRRLEEVSKVEKGDILITVATDPGWTTVFSFIAGVVVETGGVVAHAVMISREYGLPCVAHLARACDLIPDGATITVDGTNGRVIVHDPKR